MDLVCALHVSTEFTRKCSLVDPVYGYVCRYAGSQGW